MVPKAVVRRKSRRLIINLLLIFPLSSVWNKQTVTLFQNTIERGLARIVFEDNLSFRQHSKHKINELPSDQ